jgi:cytochrome c553
MDRANGARHNPASRFSLASLDAGMPLGNFGMRSSTLAALLLASALPLAGHAAEDEEAVARGRLKAYTCTGCHGITGYSNAYPNYHVPRIAGQNYQYLVAAIKGYQSGQRKHPTMNAQAQSLSEQDVLDIAAYLAASAKP